jgi:hypothetical protein
VARNNLQRVGYDLHVVAVEKEGDSSPPSDGGEGAGGRERWRCLMFQRREHGNRKT